MTKPQIIVRVQSDNFNADAIETELKAGTKDIGAMVRFSGLCRSENGALEALELEHYPAMALGQLQMIAEKSAARFSLDGLALLHRYGKLLPGEDIVLVIAASRHRQAAFDGANFVMDYLKSEAPFWKKEHRKDGATVWVDAKADDDAAKLKWNKKNVQN